MSFLTPERVPVEVYRWDDAGAPSLDKTPNCMATIFKACLVTGYGTKDPAGWTMPFEDAAAGVKVLRPEVSANTDFYLRLSADTGTEMVAQVYLDMTNANTGDLKLQCSTPFKYAKKNSDGKWALIASPQGFWFFCSQRFDGPSEQTGANFYNGILSNKDADAVLLAHTGGVFDDGDFEDIITTAQNPAQMLAGGIVSTAKYLSIYPNDSADILLPLLITDNTNAIAIPGVLVPLNRRGRVNFEVAMQSNGPDFVESLSFGSGGRNSYARIINIAANYWWY